MERSGEEWRGVEKAWRGSALTVKEAICLRVAVGQKLPQHMSRLPMATSCTHAVQEEPGENSAERGLTLPCGEDGVVRRWGVMR